MTSQVFNSFPQQCRPVTNYTEYEKQSISTNTWNLKENWNLHFFICDCGFVFGRCCDVILLWCHQYCRNLTSFQPFNLSYFAYFSTIPSMTSNYVAMYLFKWQTFVLEIGYTFLTAILHISCAIWFVLANLVSFFHANASISYMELAMECYFLDTMDLCLTMILCCLWCLSS